MTYNNRAEFILKGEYNPKTGNNEEGESRIISHLDIRSRRQEKLSSDASYSYRNFLSVKSQYPFPKNATLKWQGEKWKAIAGSFEQYDKNRNRKWYSARYIQIGGNDLNG